MTPYYQDDRKGSLMGWTQVGRDHRCDPPPQYGRDGEVIQCDECGRKMEQMGGYWIELPPTGWRR